MRERNFLKDVAMEPILQMRHVTKSFFGVKANDNVDFDLFPGEIHALLGENGAGKTTLMNILYGIYPCDEGEIRWKGEVVRFFPERSHRP